MTTPRYKKQRMPEELKDAWVKDLRNPKIKQTDNVLSNKEGGFCCLGRLMVVAEGGVRKRDTHNLEGYLPSSNFARRHNIEGMIDKEEEKGNNSLNFKLKINGRVKWASEHNDEGRTFLEIADAIERDVGEI